MRDLDDKIIYALNTTVQTESFRGQANPEKQCKELYSQLNKNYSSRDTMIRKCIAHTSEEVKALRSQHDANPDDISVMKLLKREQQKARSLQTELSVEEVVKDRTSKIFYERCRSFYKPENLKL